jgi:hypothetical protein
VEFLISFVLACMYIQTPGRVERTLDTLFKRGEERAAYLKISAFT